MSAELDDLTDTQGWHMNHDQNTFFLNTKKMPSTMNPYLASRSAIARAYGTDDDCVHLEIASVADDGGEYTNHAIIIRGWGEEQVHDHSSFAEGSVEARTHTRPYWIVQNSWGEGTATAAPRSWRAAWTTPGSSTRALTFVWMARGG